jgi:hypothetical protein
LQNRNGTFRVLFCYHGKRHTFTIGAVGQDEAERKSGQVDYWLMRLKQGLAKIPEGVDVVTFMEHDGKPPAHVPTQPDEATKVVTLGYLKERYLETFANGTIEANTLDTCKIHLSHFCRILGEGFPLGELTQAKPVFPMFEGQQHAQRVWHGSALPEGRAYGSKQFLVAERLAQGRDGAQQLGDP